MAKKFKSYEDAMNNLSDVDVTDLDQLKMADSDGNSWTVAHELAILNRLPEENINKDVLKIAKEDTGATVAHILAIVKRLPEKFMTHDILKLARKDNKWTVAHELAKGDRLPEDKITKDILSLSTSDTKETVAEVLAKYGTYPDRFKTPELLLKKSDSGYVFEYLKEYRGMSLDSAEDDLDLYLLAMSKYKYPKIDFDKFKELTKKHGLDKMKKLVKLSVEK